jgi:hypothetical protein
MPNMDESILLSVVKRDIDASTGHAYEELNIERARALKFYLGEPYGNEVKGRSQMITTEVADTIESMLPQILKPFVSQDKVVFFDAQGPEDEQAAKQETEYVNHVFYKDNDGVMVLYTWCKDGLLSKNGVVKYYWDDDYEVTHESYSDLTEQELMMLLSDDDVEVVEQEATLVQAMLDTPMGPVAEEKSSYDVKIKRTNNKGRVVIQPVPPEEFLIIPEESESKIEDVTFCAHHTDKRVYELIAMGYDEDEVLEFAGSGRESLSGVDHDDYEREQRFADISGRATSDTEDNVGDPMLRVVKYTEVYKRVDYDQDGYAELRKICLLDENHILNNEEIDYIPFEHWTPVPMTHRFIGRSAADQTMDLQLQKSTLLRNIFDNFYLTNNVRTAVVDGEVNLADLMNSTPGGVVRMSAQGMVQPLQTQQLSNSAFSLLEYLDTIKENRTGSTRYNQGIDADSLNKTASGINRIMDASAQRLELIAKLFGEAVKRLMIGVHRLLLQNQDKERIISIRGNWVPVNPGHWKERADMTVMVGLGTGDKDKVMSYLMTILTLQKEAMTAGLPIVQLNNLYNTLAKFVETGGEEPLQFFTDPQMLPPPEPPEPTPEEQLIQAQAEAARNDSQVKLRENEQDYEIQMRKLLLEERKVAVQERKLAMEEAQFLTDKQDQVWQAQIDARRAEFETQVEAQ